MHIYKKHVIEESQTDIQCDPQKWDLNNCVVENESPSEIIRKKSCSIFSLKHLPVKGTLCGDVIINNVPFIFHEQPSGKITSHPAVLKISRMEGLIFVSCMPSDVVSLNVDYEYTP